jgi:hypothetical protein
MTSGAFRLIALVVFGLCSAGAQAQQASQDVWSPGRIIGYIGETTGIHDKVPPAPAFVAKTRPPEWELDYRPLDPTQAEAPPNANAAAQAVGQELDAAKAANRRLATGGAAPAARKPANRPKKGMDPFDDADGATTN